ncbi:MAG: hypothetical protein JWN17_3110 [Frankiales bacterium]|nr:hypothetical protein [Frankiales bacterium]
MDTAFALLQAQTEALAQLPDVVGKIDRAVRGLGETVQQARDTIAAVQRLTARMDGIVAELEEPLRELAPGLRKLAVVLDDEVVSDLPQTLRTIQSDVLPVIRTLADTHDKVDRLMGLMDAFGGLPGAGLLGRRRPQPPARPSIVVEQDPPVRD